MHTDTTTAVADRAAIEALARELTDEQWRDVFGPGTMTEWSSDECRALLAYLDEVWAGLTATMRAHVLHGIGGATANTIAAMERRGLVADAPERPGYCALTPLGRAVLRRAKEQGHA